MEQDIAGEVRQLAGSLLVKIRKAIEELDDNYETVETKEGEKPDQITVKYRRRRRGTGPVDRDGFKAITAAMREVLELSGEGSDSELRVVFDREGEEYSQ